MAGGVQFSDSRATVSNHHYTTTTAAATQKSAKTAPETQQTTSRSTPNSGPDKLSISPAAQALAANDSKSAVNKNQDVAKANTDKQPVDKSDVRAVAKAHLAEQKLAYERKHGTAGAQSVASPQEGGKASSQDDGKAGSQDGGKTGAGKPINSPGVSKDGRYVARERSQDEGGLSAAAALAKHSRAIKSYQSVQAA